MRELPTRIVADRDLPPLRRTAPADRRLRDHAVAAIWSAAAAIVLIAGLLLARGARVW